MRTESTECSVKLMYTSKMVLLGFIHKPYFYTIGGLREESKRVLSQLLYLYFSLAKITPWLN